MLLKFCCLCVNPLEENFKGVGPHCHILRAVGNPRRYYCICINSQIKYEILLVGKKE